MYVKDLSSTNVERSVSNRAQNLILLSILRNFDDSVVMADETVDTILKQSKKNQSLGAENDLIETLINSLGFDELVSSDLTKDQKQYRLVLTLTEINKSTKNFQIKNKIIVSLEDSTMEYFINEAVKSLKDKNYSIDKTNAPPPISNLLNDPIQLPTNVNPNLPELQIQNQSGSVSSFAEGFKMYLKRADDEFKKGNYKKSSQQYSKILESMETLSEENQYYFQNDMQNLKDRIKQSYAFYHAGVIRDLDIKTKEYIQNYNQSTNDTLLEKYLKEYQSYKSLPEYAIDSQIIDIYKNRLNQLVILKYSRKEESADELYKNLKFQPAISAYFKIMEEMTKYHSSLEMEKYSQKIQKKMIYTEKTAISYVDKIGLSYILLADSENSRAILERSMGNDSERIKHKDAVEKIMFKLYNLLDEHYNFAPKPIIQKYNELAVEINEDNRKDTVVSAKNIALLPFRYIYNVTRSITDIFIIKFGTGFGMSGEFLFFGVTPFQLSAMNYELSTAYGFANHIEETGPLTRLSETNNNTINLKANRESNRLGNIVGIYGPGIGTCPHIVVRYCTKDTDNSSIDWKKYSTANISVSFFGGIFVGMELHRIAEIPGVLLFQDPDIFGLKKKSKPRKGYLQKEEIPTF